MQKDTKLIYCYPVEQNSFHRYLQYTSAGSIALFQYLGRQTQILRLATLAQDDKNILADGVTARLKSCPDTKPLAKLVVFAFPLGVGALEVFYGVFVEDP